MKELDIMKLLQEIRHLAQESNAIILAHYYQDPEIQDVADFIGDSLELSRKAATTTADVIVFCGVYFMAEVAKIINPTKRVLLPDLNAGCSLADSCDAESFKKFRELHKDCVSITYINSLAKVKAYSDIICTSSSAEKIIRQVPEEKKILFAPDKFLGSFLEKKTNRKMVLWPGTCIVHESFSERKLIDMMVRHSKAYVIAHPECPGHLLRHANFIGSTTQLLKFSSERPNSEFIVLTEEGIIHQMKKVSSGSTFYVVNSSDSGCASCSKCPHMRLNTLEKLYLCLKNGYPEVVLDVEVSKMARKSLDAMLNMS